MKTCSRCKTSKAEGDFWPSNIQKDSLFPWCKQCKRAYDKARERPKELVCRRDGCGAKFTKAETGRFRYCSEKCAKAARPIVIAARKPKKKCPYMWCSRAVPKGRHRFCSDECALRSGKMSRRRPVRRLKHNSFTIRLWRETPRGLCVMCQTEPLRGKQRFVCSRDRCHRDYHSEWKREQRRAA